MGAELCRSLLVAFERAATWPVRWSWGINGGPRELRRLGLDWSTGGAYRPGCCCLLLSAGGPPRVFRMFRVFPAACPSANGTLFSSVSCVFSAAPTWSAGAAWEQQDAA
jgi:hypothetical protein